MEQREVSPSPPLTLVRRYWHRRPRQRRHDCEAAASLAAALEQIFISEPVMAASSSSGGDGLSLSPSVYSLISPVLDLGLLYSEQRKEHRILSIYALCDPMGCLTIL